MFVTSHYIDRNSQDIDIFSRNIYSSSPSFSLMQPTTNQFVTPLDEFSHISNISARENCKNLREIFMTSHYIDKKSQDINKFTENIYSSSPSFSLMQPTTSQFVTPLDEFSLMTNISARENYKISREMFVTSHYIDKKSQDIDRFSENTSKKFGNINEKSTKTNKI